MASMVVRAGARPTPEGPAVPKTLAEKVYDAHVVRSAAGEPDLLYIDLHLVHEVTSPQAFDGLRAAGRPVRRPDLTMATERSEEHTSELQSRQYLVCRLLLEKKNHTRHPLVVQAPTSLGHLP